MAVGNIGSFDTILQLMFVESKATLFTQREL